jgi:hypothetical protein
MNVNFSLANLKVMSKELLLPRMKITHQELKSYDKDYGRQRECRRVIFLF